MKDAYKVTEIALRVWFSETAASLNMSRRSVVCATVVLLIATLTGGYGLARVSLTSASGTPPPTDIAELILTTSTSGALLEAVAFSVLLLLVGPRRTSIQAMLELLPVARTSVRIGLNAPLFALAFVAACSFGMSTFVLAWADLDSGDAALLTAALPLALIVVQCLALGTLTLVGSAIRQLVHVPEQLAEAVAAGVIIVASTFLFGSQLVVPGAGGVSSHLLLSNAVVIGIVGRDPLALCVAAFWIVVSACVCFAASRYRGSPRDRGVMLLPLPRWRTERAAPAIGLTASKTLIRDPRSALAATGGTALLIASGLLLPRVVPEAIAHALAGASLLALTFTVIFVPGRFTRWSWLGTMLTARRDWWVAPSIVAHLTVAVIFGIVLGGIGLAADVLQWSDALPAALKMVTLFSAALIAGSVVPWSDDQATSGAVAAVVMILLYGFLTLPVALGATAMPSHTTLLISAAIGCGSVVVGTAAAGWRAHHDAR
ncbi:hypothetical protein [Curtobacterium sp. RRHDQ10]|uniref:hypothetical protein n=1 Tax=Curtobacterium phyllosphaerae TaxID=3413379 RepID=UPI003BF36C8C